MWPWSKKQEKSQEPEPKTTGDIAWEIITAKISAGDIELAKWYVSNWKED